MVVNRNEFENRILQVSIGEQQDDACVDEGGDENGLHDHAGLGTLCVEAHLRNQKDIQLSDHDVDDGHQHSHKVRQHKSHLGVIRVHIT